MHLPTEKPLFILAILPMALSSAFSQAADETASDATDVGTVYVTAERQLHQSLGVSKITAKDLEQHPAINDISDIVRTMPGVNLTGNTASGERGNNRQIDIRGMGPENTLIMIDGRPVTSRNAERYSWRGERNTRGDSNWVPPEEIESITVLRGPAAARYGSGAAGGVVNIVTKKVSKELHGSLNLYTNRPQDSEEGKTNRIGFNVSGPIIQDVLGFRVYGSANKTDADAENINSIATSTTTRGGRTVTTTTQGAGQEGVRNRDIAGRLAWKITPAQTLTLDSSYNRQSNIYSGDNQNNNPNAYTRSLYGSKTRQLSRTSHALTHEGIWDWGDTKVIAQIDRTANNHLEEGLTGGPEGQYTQGGDFVNSILKTKRLSAEANIPFELGVPNVVTVGMEYTDDRLSDPSSARQGFTDPGRANASKGITDVFAGISAVRSGNTSQKNWAMYAEDHISIGEKTQLIPALRFDHNSNSGNNWSPALNFVQKINSDWAIKGGIARAYKAPNLYQSNPNYILYTRGNGCTVGTLTGPNGYVCYLIGNKDLKPETSINKELGFEFARDGYQASLAYFHNDYRNKIIAGENPIAFSDIENYLYQWTNAKKALVEGLEGNLTLPLHETLKWTTNFTYMRKSINKDTGNPLSVIPKYTINTSLNWQPTEKWDAALTVTRYGKQRPRTVVRNNIEASPNSGLSFESVKPYTLVGINAGYRFTKTIDLRLGINNLFNKKLYRSASNSSAASYNEHGRSFFGSLKVGF
ncbi:MAG: FepA family TonB-dependent siderophore receptor [Neisseria sp.]|uniref:FepA family TonB-dependent siderophore receptor n=1 Tax=Neisseria sp. TaxID=192066 RepID=UPI0026DDAF21|nr:FepA family TonB-dependent siderophore receptor [Neisseria sp.]MDO4642097.1 FepA family TonB-dependent siderophore receptor [Neisseria sp.]